MSIVIQLCLYGHTHQLALSMRVVHEGARTAGREFVGEGLARRDARLGQAGDAVHAVGQALAVPVDGGVLGQAVGDEDAHPIAFHDLDGGARALTIVAPQMGLHAGGHLAHHRLGHEVEFLDALVHAPGQGPAVEGDDRVVGAPSGWLKGRCGVRLVPGYQFRQGGQGGGTDRGGSDCATGQADIPEKIATGIHGGFLFAQWPGRPVSAMAALAPAAGEGLPIWAICRSLWATQKSRRDSIELLTLAICDRASARRSKMPISMPL